uniref:EamA domain-containing protein n=1 Tax=viral metagenome TaxID=1070528 RepID=A0A6C0J2F3_9ZZZZ
MKDILDNLIKSVNWKVGRFNTLPIVFGVVMALLDIFMMGMAKEVSLKTVPYALGLGGATLIYAFQPYLFVKALTFENMTVVNLIWNLSSDIIVTLMGVLYYGESIAGLRWLALCMSLFSIGLFAYTD